MRLVLVVLVLTLAAVGGCSNDSDGAADRDRDGAGNAAGAGDADPEPEYALVRNDAWKLQEAVDPAPGDPIASLDDPPLAWYAEYVHTAGNTTRMVRVSGHAKSLEKNRADLEKTGFAFGAVDVEGWDAVGSPAAGGQPAVVVLRHGEASIVCLSYEASLDELAELAKDVEVVDEAGWRAAGGVMGRPAGPTAP